MNKLKNFSKRVFGGVFFAGAMFSSTVSNVISPVTVCAMEGSSKSNFFKYGYV